MQVHHLLPVQFKLKFKDAGLEIEDFKIKLPAWKHVLKPYGIHTVSGGNWNRVWEIFLDDKTNREKEKILRQMF